MKLRILLSLLFLLLASVRSAAQQATNSNQSDLRAQKESSSTLPASDLVVEQALKVLNDSDLAHTIKPSLQDAPCSWQNSAFPGLYPEDKGVLLDARSPAVTPLNSVTPDESEYLIRFQSAKPVQRATEQLLFADEEKWAAYRSKTIAVSAGEGSTDLSIPSYNVADMITIAVILKHAGPDGTSLFSYGYEQDGDSHVFPSRTIRLWPCAGLRTGGGQVFAHVADPSGKSKVMQLSFPRLVDGKPLISSMHEKVEFRLVINQRVFETTFFVNANDILDGSEKTLHLPSAFSDATEIVQH